MPLNFDGLGIGVSFDDDGAQPKIKSLSDTVGGLWDNLKQAGSLVGKAGSKISQGLGKLGGLGKSAMGGISLGIGRMVDAAMSPQLDNAYSSMYAGFNKSFSAMTMGMKTSEKEMKKARGIIGSVAFGLNEDMDAAAQTWAAFEKQNIDLTKVLGSRGLKGAMKDIIKITSTTGIEGQQLAAVIGGLVHGFNFTEEGAGRLADKIYAVGEMFNSGKEAISSWPSLFESLNNVAADFGKTLTPEEMEKLTLSMVQLGGGLHEALGLTSEAAMELGRTVFTTLASERESIVDMFRGRKGGFGQIAEQLFEAGADVNKVFETMATGDVVKFMDTLREMAKEAESRGGESGFAFQRLSGTIKEALGPDMTFAMKGNWDKVQQKVAEVPEAIAGDKAMGALKKAAAAHHKTGLTMGESWDRMVEGMKARLFKLSDREIGGWQKRMKTGFKNTFSVISKLAKADGPIGELTTRLLAVQRVGLSALIPGIEGLAPVLGGALEGMYPMLTALGSMGLRFASLGKMALGGGVLFGLFYLLKHGPEEAMENIKKFAKDVWDTLGKLFPSLKEKAEEIFGPDFSRQLTELDFEGLSKGLAKALDALSSEIGKKLSKVDWAGVSKTIIQGIIKGFRIAGGFIAALFSGVSDTEVEDGVKGLEKPVKAGFAAMMGNVLLALPGMIKSVAGSIWDELFNADSVGEGVTNLVNTFMGGVAILMVASKKIRMAVMNGFVGGMKGASGVVRGGLAKMKMQFVRAGRHYNVAIAKGLGRPRAMGKAFGSLAKSAKVGMAKVGASMKAGLRAAGPIVAIMAIVEGLQQMAERSEKIGEIMRNKMVPDSQKAALAGEQAFTGILSTIDTVLLGLPSSIGKALGISMDDLSSFYHEMVANFETSIAYVVAAARTAWMYITTGFDFLIKTFQRGWGYVEDLADSAFHGVWLAWKEVSGWVEKNMIQLSGTLQKTFNTIASAIMWPFESLSHSLKKWLADFVEVLFGGKLGELIQKGLGKLGIELDVVEGAKQMVKDFRKEWKEEGGEKFDKEYWKNVAEQNVKIDENINARVQKINKSIAEAQKTREEHRAESIGNVLADIAKLAGKTEDERERLTKLFFKEAGIESDEAYRAAKETGQTSKKLREEESKEEEEETKKKKKKKGRRKKNIKGELEAVEEMEIPEAKKGQFRIRSEKEWLASKEVMPLAASDRALLQEATASSAQVDKRLQELIGVIKDKPEQTVLKLDGKTVAKTVGAQQRKYAAERF